MDASRLGNDLCGGAVRFEAVDAEEDPVRGQPGQGQLGKRPLIAALRGQHQHTQGIVLRSDTLGGMAKTRISISLDPAQAERIKAAAAEGGQDVSAFMVASALGEATRRERVAASFADIDAAIAAAEAEADNLAWPPPEEVTPEDAERIRQEIATARARATAVRARRAAA